MEHLPFFIDLLFEITVALSVYLFYRATASSKTFLIIALVWIIIQTILGVSGFYLLSKNTPPKLPLLVAPPMLLIIFMMIFKKGRDFMDKLNLANLTLVHSVALLVELVLYFLLVYKYVPQSMTFEGGNFDIFSGLTAPAVYYFGFIRKVLNRAILLIWNLICLLLVINASVMAVLSIPGLQHGSGQSDIAIGIFPFILLPAVVVPIVLFAHLTSIRNLILKKTSADFRRGH